MSRVSVYLRHWRKVRGFNQEQAANYFEVKLTTWRAWEQNNSYPTMNDRNLTIFDEIFRDLKAAFSDEGISIYDLAQAEIEAAQSDSSPPTAPKLGRPFKIWPMPPLPPSPPSPPGYEPGEE